MDKIRVREFSSLRKGKDYEGREDDVMKLRRNHVVDELAQRLARERGRVSKRMGDLRLPAARNPRPQTIDGRTSFHFSHEAVSKTRNNLEKDSGLKIGPGAARRHGKYIERDGAIAKMSDKEEEALKKLLEEHPELEAGESADGVLTLERRKEAALHGYYVERQEALATQPDGEKVLFTNISPDPLERARVWDKIEEFERNPSPDQLIIHVAKHPEFWDKVSKEPGFPKPLAEALLLADPDHPYRFQTDDARSSLRWLREHPDWDKENPQVSAKLGEGGRIQYRMIGELPYELDLKGRTAILAEFAHEFERRKLPYVAVMHAPDHTNDDRNWHFHLIYYDRPIEKMVDGRWDFEADETYKAPNGTFRTHFPHRQDKLTEVNEKNWIPKMRKRLAEITNDHLQMAGVPRRVDPRRYSEMGIHREAQEHLGTRASALESMGIATPVGYRNANKEWDAVFAEIDRRREGEQKKTDAQARRYHGKVDRNESVDPNENIAMHARIERWRQRRDEAAEFASHALSVKKNYERLISRAEKVDKTCEKQLEAARKNKLPTHKKADAIRLTKRQNEALNEIKEVGAFMGPMLDAAKRWAETADRLRALAKREESEIERLLSRSSDDKAGRRAEIKNRRQREDGSFQGQDGEYRRALNKAEMDAWVQSILKGRRRLVRKDRRFVPLTSRPGDEKFLDAGNYGAMNARLAKIKESQDALIEQVVTYVGKNPHAVHRERNDQGDVVLSLRVSRPQWKSAFTDYAEDPAMRQAALAALATRDSARRDRTVEVERAPAATGAPALERAEQPRPLVDAAAVPGADGVLARISRQAVRIRLVEGAYVADEKALAVVGIIPSDLEPAFVQNRLRGVHREQQRDFARLSSFIEKHPYAIVEKDGVYKLGPKSPREVAAIAERWVGDEEMQASLKTTREALRGTSKQRQEKIVEIVPPSAEQSRRPKRDEAPQRPLPQAPSERLPASTEPLSTHTERTAPHQPAVAAPAAPAARPAAEPARAPATAKPTGPEHPVHTTQPLAPSPTSAPDRRVEEPVARRTDPQQPTLFGDEPQTPRTGQAVFENLRPSVTPLRGENAALDEWLKAGEQDRSLSDRRRLAADLARDRQAMAALASADPELARQLQADVKAFQRMQSSGKGLGKGLRPKR
ncbi:MobA/MobL family protein [Sphingomonas sp. 3-13AW]|uniref:MobA/MobL family protein n=1 Tax=Sphingomonas sp. 3-13AW TaxID=3050450 RepID=UPI003BB5AA0C